MSIDAGYYGEFDIKDSCVWVHSNIKKLSGMPELMNTGPDIGAKVH